MFGHDCPDLEHAMCGHQYPNIQLEELLWVVVVRQNRDIHPGSVAPSTLTVSPAYSMAGWTCSLLLASCVIINEVQDRYDPVSLAGVCNPTWPIRG